MTAQIHYQLCTELAVALQARSLYLCCAESCTGGGISQALTELPGSSAWFDGGWVTYSNAAKQQLLGVREQTLLEWGAVSEQTAREMAEGALQRSPQASLSLAVTGIAGPSGGTLEKPVGTVWLAWAWQGKSTRTQCEVFSGDRSAVREQTITVALQGLLAWERGTADNR